MRSGEYGMGIDIGDVVVSAAVCGTDGAAVPLALGHGPVTATVAADGRIGLVPADAAAGRTALMARVGDPVPVYAGDRGMSAAELVAGVVQRVREAAAETEGRHDAWTVVTVPPSWAGHRCAALATALDDAGVPRFSLVSSAVAAVAAHVAAGDLPPEPTVAVYDLGAEFLDTAVVGPTPASPLTHLAVPPTPVPWGGDDVDDLVLARVLDGLGRPPADARALRTAVRAAKERLSTATAVQVLADGPDGPVRLTREELEEELAGPVRRSAEALAATVTAAGLAPDDIAAVVLAGGGGRIPVVAEILSAELGRPLVVGSDPALTPALGAAALAAEALAGEERAAGASAAPSGAGSPAGTASPVVRQDPPVVVDAPAAPRPRAPRGRTGPGSPPRPHTGPPPRPGRRLGRGAVVAGLAAGLLALGPAAAGLFDAALTPGPAEQDSSAGADAGVTADGWAAPGDGAADPGDGAAAAGTQPPVDGEPGARATGSPRTSLAALLADAARPGVVSAAGDEAPAAGRTLVSASTESATAADTGRPTGGTMPSGTVLRGAPAGGTPGDTAVLQGTTGGGRPAPSQPSTAPSSAPASPTTRPSAPKPPAVEATGSGETAPLAETSAPASPTTQPPAPKPPAVEPPGSGDTGSAAPEPPAAETPTSEAPADEAPADEAPSAPAGDAAAVAETA